MYQYVPLLSSLRSLLSDPSIIDQVEQCQSCVHTDGVVEDVCDGSVFRTHPLFSSDPSALQIIAVFDELELCNPLGTHVKHKLAIVLFTLGNIHPKYRSSLRVIHLLSRTSEQRTLWEGIFCPLFGGCPYLGGSIV